MAGRPLRVAAGPGQRHRPGRRRAAAGPGPGRPVPDHQPPRDRLARHRGAGPAGCAGPGRGAGPAGRDPHPGPAAGGGRRRRSCARSWASCRWPSSRPAPTSPRPAPARGSTWTCWPATRPPCTRPPPKAATPPGPSPGSGGSHWTGWRMTRWPGRCCGSWPGTPPRPSPAPCWTGWPTPRRCCRAVGRLAAYSMLTADAGILAVHRLVQAVARTPDPGDPHRDPQAIDDARDQATRLLADAIPPTGQDPAGWPALADAAPAHRRPGQPRARRTRTPQTTAHLLNQAGLFLDNQGQPCPRGPVPPACPRRPACGCWARTTPTP